MNQEELSELAALKSDLKRMLEILENNKELGKNARGGASETHSDLALTETQELAETQHGTEVIREK